jgi:copper homeostasis protein (lipoprotein)
MKTTAVFGVLFLLGSTALDARIQRAAPPASNVVVGVFEGTLPCADCSGLRTQLTLSAKTSGADNGTFVTKYTYVGKGATRDDTGTWKIVRGTPADKNAVIYELTVKGATSKERWLQIGAGELQQVDEKLQPIDAPMPLRLKRAAAPAAPPPGAYRSIAKDDGAVDKAAAFAIKQQKDKTPALALVGVTSAEKQIVAGTNYRLCLSVKRSANPEPARAVVFQDLKGAMHLSSWAFEPCGG